MVTTARHEAGLRVRKSCNTLLEIVGFTTSDACDFMRSFSITNENGAKTLKRTGARDCYPQFKLLLSKMS